MADGDNRPVLGPLVRSLLAFAAVAAANAGRRAAALLAGYLVAGLLLAVSLCFLTLSGYRALSHGLGDVVAALIVGSLYLVLGLVVLLVLLSRRR